MIHPDCLWIPSPNYGYPRGVLKQLAVKIQEANRSGEFWHSIVGSLAAAKNRFLNPAEEASAHFLFPRDGIPTQMVDSDDAAWHSGNYLANLHFHGFEFEGGAPGNLSEPLTENQIEWGIKITRWLRDVHNSPQIYVRRETLWEHNEVQATACPSGRIPWERLISEMEPIEEEDMRLITIKTQSSPTQWVTDGMTRWPFTTQAILTEFAGLGLMENQSHIIITDALMDSIPKIPASGSSGDGLTREEAIEANQEAARRGTG